MSSSPPPPPPPASISRSTFSQALNLYPSLVEKVYASKLKNDAKKVAEAVTRDGWRFGELPLLIAERKGKAAGKGLSKDDVERLVLWKITHGHSRPFLPGMVRKNDASAIETQTSLAFRELSSAAPTSKSPTLATVSTALDHVCKLTGIGPATGTLILSVFDPEHIPFFQDEMFAWFFPDNSGSGSGKLKYTAKEYQQLFEAVGPVLKRLSVKAVELEKVAYVLGHMALLGEDERKTLEESSTANEKSESKNEDDAPKGDNQGSKANTLRKEPTVPKKARKRTVEDQDGQGMNDNQAPKRRSQRKR